jgi:transcriptional regulator with XRE-family HTH domain
MASLRTKLGAKIRKLRTERHYSQEQLAGLAGMNAKYLSEVERGERNLSVELLVALANVLEVSPADLLADEQHPSREELIGKIVRQLQHMPLDLLIFVHRNLLLVKY